MQYQCSTGVLPLNARATSVRYQTVPVEDQDNTSARPIPGRPLRSEMPVDHSSGLRPSPKRRPDRPHLECIWSAEQGGGARCPEKSGCLRKTVGITNMERHIAVNPAGARQQGVHVVIGLERRHRASGTSCAQSERQTERAQEHSLRDMVFITGSSWRQSGYRRCAMQPPSVCVRGRRRGSHVRAASGASDYDGRASAKPEDYPREGRRRRHRTHSRLLEDTPHRTDRWTDVPKCARK